MDLLRATLRMAAPLLYAALGGAWTQQTGILNIGQEGAMLLASFFAILGNYHLGGWLAGVAVAVAASLAYNMLFGLLCVTLRSNIWVVGMTLNVLADNVVMILMKYFFHTKGGFRDPSIVPMPDVSLPFLPDWLNGLSIAVWGAFAVLAVMLWIDRNTVFGMRLKGAGDNEEALASAGVSPARMRYRTLLVNGVLVGIAGAYLSTSYLLAFVSGMSAGRGWIAVAAVIFGDGRLGWTVVGVFLFGLAQAAGIELQSHGFSSHLTLMLPYLLVIVALVAKQWRLPGRLHAPGRKTPHSGESHTKR